MRVEIDGQRYWAQDGGGYVFVEHPESGRVGCLGRQITDGRGNALEARDEADLRRVVRRHIRAAARVSQ